MKETDMSEIEQNKMKCPRCGYEDVGKYCSRCSYELDKRIGNVFRELYHAFILKYFDYFPFWSKFARTWWHCFIHPGKINLKETLNDSKYLYDLKFISTLFYLSIGTALIKSIFQFESSDSGSAAYPLLKFLFDLMIQSYVLWIFGFLLIAFIWTGRTWKKWMKMEIKDQRQLDSIFIYEFGTLSTIIIVLLWVLNYKPGDEITNTLKSTLIVLSSVAVIHFLYLLIAVGIRAKLLMKRLIMISLASIYISIFVALGAQIITVPVVLLPIAIILSPVYFIVRGIWKKIKKLAI